MKVGLFVGVHAVKLEEVERRLRNDLMHEAMAWGGRLLLHRDVTASKTTDQDGGGASPGAVASEDDDDITQNGELMPDNNAIAAFWDSTGAFTSPPPPTHPPTRVLICIYNPPSARYTGACSHRATLSTYLRPYFQENAYLSYCVCNVMQCRLAENARQFSSLSSSPREAVSHGVQATAAPLPQL